MPKQRSRLVNGEIEFWRGRQWQVTTLGIGMITFPWTWMDWRVARRGLGDSVFNKNGIQLTWLSQRHDTDVEDLIDAYTFACRCPNVPAAHLPRACEVARKLNARAKEGHARREARREEIVRTFDGPP
jgi:hypothetical protein